MRIVVSIWVFPFFGVFQIFQEMLYFWLWRRLRRKQIEQITKNELDFWLLFVLKISFLLALHEIWKSIGFIDLSHVVPVPHLQYPL
jgi:hypothetical protein